MPEEAMFEDPYAKSAVTTEQQENKGPKNPDLGTRFSQHNTIYYIIVYM